MTKTKLLLVDDRPENLLALENIVAGPNVAVFKAQSASDALALILDHQFALALLDVQMPDINGFELARLMRSAERSRVVPIIFVTASQGASHQVFEGYENGAVDYLLKPLDAHIVRSKVKVFVELDQKTKAFEEKLHEVEALREAAESANQAKSRFLANMSHEIRTPLGAVLGFAQLLKLTEQSQEDKDNCINAIERNGQLLLQLVNDVLDLSKIEAEKIEIELASTSLAELVADLNVVHSHKAAEKGIRIQFTAEGRLPKKLTTDVLRLKQILYNIVGNAVKFTDRGQVVVHISYDQARRSGPLVFRIKDSGCGLTDSQTSRIFQPFMQADGSTNRRYGGTGLGLIIAKQLANLLGGDVVLTESWPGRGSTFLVSIDPGPVQASDLVDGAALLHERPISIVGGGSGQASMLKGVRVLVADDAYDNRNLLNRVLTLAGAFVETAADGAEVVKKAREGRFDVVLMDIQMPEMDGYEATTLLRSQGFRAPIIALTAHGMKEDLTRCLEAGCNFHMSKPVHHPKLVTTIADFVRRAKN